MEAARPAHQAPTYSLLAIFALVFAILAWTLLPLMGVALANINIGAFIGMPLAGSVIASICGGIAQRKIHESRGLLLGSGLAKAARLMAYVQYTLIVLLFVFAFLSTGGVMEHHISLLIPQ